MNWCTCPHCGHKLFKYSDVTRGEINIKCSSCKNIVTISLLNGKSWWLE